MNVKKQLWSVARVVVPGMGFALTCSGAYMISLQTESGYTWIVIPAYILMVLGLLAVLTGLFWTICHSMRSKMYQRGRCEQHSQIYTIERPSFFPPSYEESQRREACQGAAREFVVVVDGVDVVIAPPLYSQDSVEPPDCTWSWEQPPPYSQVEHIQQGEEGAEERREALSRH